ncbi:MAG TPA: hypothetical protein VGS22_08530 [Thermoanaerobaculia bacterium]|jgi:hypothetical protein|nr:hypothetical protein [Thermoanaerobaculia bacterium]
MDLSPALCCFSCPLPPGLAVGMILLSLALLGVGRYLNTRLFKGSELAGQVIAGLGMVLTLFGLTAVLRFGIWPSPAVLQMEVTQQERILFGSTRLGIPVLWLAAAIAVWMFAERCRPRSDPRELDVQPFGCISSRREP